MLEIFISLNLFCLLLNFSPSKRLSYFLNVSLNLLFVVSVYACITTGFKSIYIFSLIGIPIAWYRAGFKISYSSKTELLSSLILVNLAWLIFFITYFIGSGFQLSVSHEDYIIYSRLARYNDIFGVENTLGFYNLFEIAQRNEIYHFFELWLTNVGSFFNQQGQLKNLMFFVLPLVSCVSVMGLREMINSIRWHKSLVIFLLALLVSSPYDFLINFIEYPLPLSGVGNILLYPKHIIIFPIILFLIDSVEKGKVDYFMASLISFFYPLIIPVLFPALVIYEWRQSGFKFNKSIFYLISFTILAAVFMLMHSSRESIFNFSGLFNLRMMARIVLIGFVVPIFFYGFIWKVFFQRSDKQLASFLGILLVVANGLWFLLQINLDANQFFSIPFHSILVLLTAISIFTLFERKKYWLTIACLVFYIGPLVFAFAQTDFLKSPKDLVHLLELVPKKEKIIYAPVRSQLTNVYSYNERMSLPNISLFIEREDLHLINIGASYPAPFDLDNPMRKAAFDFFRSISPYFNSCGEMHQSDLSCLDNFASNNNISFLLADSKIRPGSKWIEKGSTNGLTLFCYKK